MDVEWLILADAAQITGGKLFLLGGGWDVLTVSRPFPVTQRCAVATSFRVPWNETNTRRGIEIRVVTEDGVELVKVDGQVEVGRPAGIPPGSDQRAQITADMTLRLEAAGTYSVIASVEGVEGARTLFRVVRRG
jgi:hypothetical protein